MYPDATSSTSPTTDPPVPPPPLTTAEARKIRWRARGGFAEAWAWRCEGFTGYRPFLHALACALLCCALAGCGGGSAEAPPTNAVGIGGTVFTRDSGGRPLAVDLTVVVTGQGVKPVGGR